MLAGNNRRTGGEQAWVAAGEMPDRETEGNR